MIGHAQKGARTKGFPIHLQAAQIAHDGTADIPPVHANLLLDPQVQIGPARVQHPPTASKQNLDACAKQVTTTAEPGSAILHGHSARLNIQHPTAATIATLRTGQQK